MKYVKIYNEKMQCLGVADIEQNYDKDGYVKLFDSTTMKFRGVVDVDDIPESGDNMPVVKVFDENMLPCGVVTADNIRHSDGYLIRLRKDPSTTGTVTGGGRFIAGTSVTVVATPDAQSDYPEFDGWYEGETKVSENASYTFTVSGARTLVAKFKEAQKTLVASVWANQACTKRPVAGQTYTTLYVKLHKAFGFDDYLSLGDTVVGFSDLTVYTPTTDDPDSLYSITLWTDWFSVEVNEPLTSGQVLAATAQTPYPVASPFVVDFYQD